MLDLLTGVRHNGDQQDACCVCDGFSNCILTAIVLTSMLMLPCCCWMYGRASVQELLQLQGVRNQQLLLLQQYTLPSNAAAVAAAD
jgi:hypothetical protein